MEAFCEEDIFSLHTCHFLSTLALSVLTAAVTGRPGGSRSLSLPPPPYTYPLFLRVSVAQENEHQILSHLNLNPRFECASVSVSENESLPHPLPAPEATRMNYIGGPSTGPRNVLMTILIICPRHWRNSEYEGKILFVHF